MALSNPRFLHPGAVDPKMTTKGQWFEIKLDEFTLQKQLPCYFLQDEWWVETVVWDAWEQELVGYFIHNGYSGPEIEAFIRSHALSGTGKADRT